ncbi:hypothetical protein [Variovorax sp. KK3]|uniref:hypothetical protein n=1 Tax=Variovorax sp. KK3 TaxID=1855728 RepID=UPI003AB076AB
MAGTVPVVGYKDGNGRYIAYMPKTKSIGTYPIYSQRTSAGNCEPVQPASHPGYPAEAIPMDSYYVAPFRVE